MGIGEPTIVGREGVDGGARGGEQATGAVHDRESQYGVGWIEGPGELVAVVSGEEARAPGDVDVPIGSLQWSQPRAGAPQREERARGAVRGSERQHVAREVRAVELAVDPEGRFRRQPGSDRGAR